MCSVTACTITCTYKTWIWYYFDCAVMLLICHLFMEYYNLGYLYCITLTTPLGIFIDLEYHLVY